MLIGLTVFLFLNQNVFYKSQLIFTINLIVMMFAFMYLSKYLDYDGQSMIASIIQLFLFYITHLTLKSMLQCFGVDIEEYHNLSLPEICSHNLKSYILSIQKQVSDEDLDDELKDILNKDKSNFT